MNLAKRYDRGAIGHYRMVLMLNDSRDSWLNKPTVPWVFPLPTRSQLTLYAFKSLVNHRPHSNLGFES